LFVYEVILASLALMEAKRARDEEALQVKGQ
jgi:hypothetical protein